MNSNTGYIDTADLRMSWFEATWDSAIYASPVLQIDQIEFRGIGADVDITAFEAKRDFIGCDLVSCRLTHDRLKESMFLESRGFRFIEMLYTPELDLHSYTCVPNSLILDVAPAVESDMPKVAQIASDSFRSERFYMDWRLSPVLSDRRYENWAKSSVHHATQNLFVLRYENMVVAFFVTEMLADGTCYWHLTAVAPEFQGKGYGKAAWITMTEHAKEQGAKRVRSSIVARNNRVLNLYASQNFRFYKPQMTFHWVRIS